MDSMKIASLVQLTYDILGLANPRQGIVDAVIEECHFFDNAAYSFLSQKISNLEDRPKNLSATLKAWYSEWKRATQGEKHEHKGKCPICFNGEGFFWLWREDAQGFWHRMVSPCPKCNRNFSPEEPPSMRALQNSGAVVMPPNYPGGAIRYEREHGLDLVPDNRRRSA